MQETRRKKNRRAIKTRRARRLKADFSMTFSFLHMAAIRQITVPEALNKATELAEAPLIIVEIDDDSATPEEDVEG